MLRAESLRVRIADRLLIDNLDLEVKAGECWGVLGRNGAGKSTPLHVLAGLRAPDDGRVFFGGQPLGRMAERT